MPKKRIVVALGRNAFGKTLPEQKTAVKEAAKAIADLAELKYQIVITHSNGPQVGIDSHGYDRIWQYTSGFYSCAYGSLQCYEPGLHWIRPSE